MGPWSGDHGNYHKTLLLVTHTKLQWGRGLVTTETELRVNYMVEKGLASMGPWSGDHGNLSRRPLTARQPFASMGPWSGDHGNGAP